MNNTRTMELAEQIAKAAHILTKAAGGDNHDLVSALISALAVTIASGLKDASDPTDTGKLAGDHLASRVTQMADAFRLNKQVDLMNACIRKLKALPISVEEEAALYHIGIVDKEGALTERGRDSAEYAKSLSRK